ncbi:MAG: response regulator [bacterium]
MRILIADDHPIFRQGLLKILEGEPSFEVVGETGDGKDAYEMLRELRPDVALLDISMPGMSGLEIVKEMNKRDSEVDFVILTMFSEEEYFNEAIEQGVKGYLLKENATSDLVSCLKAVEKGRHYVSPSISDYLIKRRERAKSLGEQMPALQNLTKMELRVLRLLSENKTSKEIAGELYVSHRTVQNHRHNIGVKLRLKGPNRLLQFAIENRASLSGAFASAAEVEADMDEPSENRLAQALQRRLVWFGAVVLLVALVAGAAFIFYWPESMQRSLRPIADFDRNRIAVLPFANISQDPTDEFLSDGITEELIMTLSKIKPLRVIASTSVMKFKDREKGIGEIGRELQVGTILEGSVRKAGNKLRVSAQLIDAVTEEHLWAQDYDREFNDVFAIQTDIAKRVADALKVQLLVQSNPEVGRVPAPNQNAHTYYLKGRYFWNKRNNEAFHTALEYFQKAIETDPTYAKAYVGFADCYLQLGEWGCLPALEAFAKVEENVLQALSIDAGLGEAHGTLAVAYHSLVWNWQSAEEEFKIAIELNTNYATVHQWFAEYLSIMGRHDEAMKEIERARELDPLSLVIGAVTGWLYYCAGDYDKAIEQLSKTAGMDSSFALTAVYLGRAYLSKSMHREALAVLRNAKQRFPHNTTVLAALGYALAVSGGAKEARGIIEQLNLATEQSYSTSSFKALIYAGLGEDDLALTWLERAYENHVPWLSWVAVDPSYDHLRSYPRFIALMEKMSLPNA